MLVLIFFGLGLARCSENSQAQGPVLAAGWTQEQLNAEIQQCIEDATTSSTATPGQTTLAQATAYCTCLFNHVAQQISFSDYNNLTGSASLDPLQALAQLEQTSGAVECQSLSGPVTGGNPLPSWP
jgi:hypothetical protein